MKNSNVHRLEPELERATTARMKSLPEHFEFPLTLRVPRSAFTIVAPEPATITQHTAEQHFGIPASVYKRMVRDGLFPTKRIGRLIFASYDDVKRAVTEGAVAQERVQKAVELAERHPDEAPMSVEAALAYVASGRTLTEERARQQEIQRLAFDLSSKYGEKLDDESPNPHYDARLSRHATDLIAASMGLVRSTNVPNPEGSSSGRRREGGYYRQCCWRDRPAFAVKQTWTDEHYWCGGPVCVPCAERRGPRERIVDIETRTILHQPTDATVPTSWEAPRRRGRREPV